MKWASKNKIILIFTMLIFFKKIKKNTCRYHYEILMPWSTQFLRYKAKHTETVNFRSFFTLLPPKKPQNHNFEKYKNFLWYHHFTCVPKITIYVLPEIQGDTDRIFCHFGRFFALLPKIPKNYDQMMHSSWDMVRDRWMDGQADGWTEKVTYGGGCPT